MKLMMELRKVTTALGMKFHRFLPTIPARKACARPLEVRCPCNHLQQGLLRNIHISKNAPAYLRTCHFLDSLRLRSYMTPLVVSYSWDISTYGVILNTCYHKLSLWFSFLEHCFTKRIFGVILFLLAYIVMVPYTLFCFWVVKAALFKIVYLSSEVLSPRKSSAIISPSHQLKHANSLTKHDESGIPSGPGAAEPVACKSSCFLYAFS